MELRHLRYFIAVAEGLSFTRAAEALHLAQPSLTRQIHNLEEELGVRLLDRTQNQVSLTEEGKSFLVDAKRLVALSLESVKSVQRFGLGQSAPLNLGYSFKYSFSLLPATLTLFSQNHPQSGVNLFDLSPAAQLRALQSREIDLGFVGLRPAVDSKNMGALFWQCVAQHEVVAVLPAGHQLAKKSKIKLTDLKSLFFVALSEESHPGHLAWLSSLCEQAGFTPRVLQDVELESGIMAFVAEGLGVALAREQIKNLPHRGVVFRPLVTSVKADYWIAWHRQNGSNALAQFIQIVKKKVGPLLPGMT
ncbi:MAG: LysR family transcriptional regulator [Akkermansiaceae bacterium]|nr:LysR family transcriptional regulator [Verrucomicrobiales bacterium]